MYFVNSPKIFDLFYSDLIWRMQGSEKKLFLTFDDGPHKAITPEILEILDHFKAKATFFCVGNKIDKFPELIEQIKKEEHTLGNHTYGHLKGKSTQTTAFMEDISRCDNLLNSKLFRPPYGSIKWKQIKKLKDKYKIYMWTVLPGDFDPNVSKEKCLKRSIKYTKNGTIIVYHDNEKSKEKVLYTLPKYIDHFQKLGYTFEAL